MKRHKSKIPFRAKPPDFFYDKNRTINMFTSFSFARSLKYLFILYFQTRFDFSLGAKHKNKINEPDINEIATNDAFEKASLPITLPNPYK